MKTVTKVLVAVHVFPSKGGGRIEKLVKLLPQNGIQPVIMSPKETQSDTARRILEAVYPRDLECHYVPSLGPTYFAERLLDRAPDARHYKLLSALSFAERCVYVPDYMVRWVPLGVRLGRRLATEHGIRVVLTSSPPESTHLIGLRLKRDHGLKWVADFRDLWTARTRLYRPATVFHDRWIRRLERTILETADHIIANTDENRAYYLRTFDVDPRKISVIPNGFDRDDVPGAGPYAGGGDVFQIGYMGNLAKHDMPWRPFLRALRLLRDEFGSSNVRFVHCGPSSREVDEEIGRLKLEDVVTRHGDLTHHEAMRITASTDLRLVLLADNSYSRSMVPAKLYNYLIMDGPILAVAPLEGAAARVLAETRSGVIVSPSDDGGQAFQHLRVFYSKWRLGERLVDSDSERIEVYNRRRHAEALAGVFQSLQGSRSHVSHRSHAGQPSVAPLSDRAHDDGSSHRAVS